MYRIHLFLCTAVLVVLCQACQKGYTITGTISGDGIEGQPVTLLELRGLGSPAEIQRATIKNGTFTMKGVVAYPDMHLLYINGNGPVELFLDNADIRITARADSLDGAEISGSAAQAEYEMFFARLQPYQDAMSDIADRAEAYSAGLDSLPRPEKTPEAEWTAHIDSLRQAANDSLAIQLREMAMNGKYFIYEWVTEHSDSYVSAFIAYEMLKNTSNTDEISKLLAAINRPELKDSQWVRLLGTHLRYLTRTIEGATYTDFTMPSWNGGDVTLSDYVGSHPYVVLYFWASWNPNSRTWQKEIVPVYEKYKGHDVAFVSVSLDRKFEDWDLALKEDSIPWIQLSSCNGWQTEAVELYNVNEIPQTFVINNEGTILLRIKDPRELFRNFERIYPDAAQDEQ